MVELAIYLFEPARLGRGGDSEQVDQLVSLLVEIRQLAISQAILESS
jgi:hypothetical protein